MKYATFVLLCAQRKYTVAQLRCDVRPTDDLLKLMDAVGLARYEQYVNRLLREVAQSATRN